MKLKKMKKTIINTIWLPFYTFMYSLTFANKKATSDFKKIEAHNEYKKDHSYKLVLKNLTKEELENSKKKLEVE